MKKWKRILIVALAVAAAAGAWRLKYEIEYGRVDRRIERLRGELAAIRREMAAGTARRDLGAGGASMPSIDMAIQGAAAELAALTRPSHIRRLVWYLGDEDREVKSAVSNALAAMGARAVEPVVEGLTENSCRLAPPPPAWRSIEPYLPRTVHAVLDEHRSDGLAHSCLVVENGAWVLVGLGAPAKPRILQLVQSPDPEISRAMRMAVSSVHNTTSYEIANALLARDGALVWGNLVMSLSGITSYQCLPEMDKGAYDAVASLLEEPGARITRFAVRLLGGVENAEAADALAAFMDGAGELRVEAAMALAMHHDARALPALLEAVESGGADGPGAAVRLARIPEDRAVEAILKAAESQDVEMRRGAASALRPLIEKDLASAEAKARAREAAARLSVDADDQVRYLAERAVIPPAAGDLASANERYKDPHEGAVWRAGGVRALGDYAGDDVTDALVDALSDPHPWVRRVAAGSLSRIAKRGSISEAVKPRVREGLEKAKGDADVSVRQAASEALDVLEAR